MEVLSPRSANVPMKPQSDMKKVEARKKSGEKVQNPDKIEDKWRPADVVREPGSDGDAYITGKKLGKGSFAVCFEGRSKKTSEVYALKVVKSHVEQKRQLEKVSSQQAVCEKFLIRRAVSHGVTDPCQNAPSQCRRILSCLFIRESYLCGPGTLPQRLSHGNGEKPRQSKLTGS
jgi:serine/threonine protein kinase